VVEAIASALKKVADDVVTGRRCADDIMLGSCNVLS